jgi:hypothetical protein
MLHTAKPNIRINVLQVLDLIYMAKLVENSLGSNVFIDDVVNGDPAPCPQ